MKTDNIKGWLFEIVAILIPGVFAFVLLASFVSEPREFISRFLDTQKIRSIILPFQENLINYAFIFSIGFIIGHLTQQISIYCIWFYERVFRVKGFSIIEEIFGIKEVREYILPQESGIEVNGIGLKNYDYFMMIYPETAPNTKRDLFIAISDFCGAMLVVTNMIMVLCLASTIAVLSNRGDIPLFRIILIELLGMLLTYLWVKRRVFFNDMANRMVVTYFLAKFGSDLRSKTIIEREQQNDKSNANLAS